MTSPAKDGLRAHFMAQRRGLSPLHRQAVGSRLRRVATGLAELADARVVAAYAAVGDEPDTAPLLTALRVAGVRVLLPVGSTGGWAVDDGRRRPGRWGIPEPLGPPAELAEASVVLAPALAVDRRGVRLGRGGGFYDRALTGVCVASFAVVYDAELVAELPSEPHDVAVGGALTPSGVVRFR